MAKARQGTRARSRSSSRSITSVTYWRRFATHRLIYVGIAVLFALGMVVYFGAGPSGGRGAPGENTASGPIVTVNGEQVTRAEFDTVWNQQRAQFGLSDADAATGARMQGMLLSELIDQALLRSIAKQRGLKVADPDIDKAIDQIRQRAGTKAKPATDDDVLQVTGMPSMDDLRESLRKQLMATKLAEALASSQRITEDDLQKSYEQAKLRHILIATIGGSRPIPGALPDAQARNRTEQILAKLKAGDDFADLANEYSMDPGNSRPAPGAPATRRSGAKQGGELGWAPLSNYVPEFADAARKLKNGEISGIVKTPYGYHIIQREDFKLALPADYAKKKNELLADLRQQRARDEVGKLLTEARKTAKIVWADPSMQWRYDIGQMFNGMQPNVDPRQAQEKLVAELRGVVKRNPEDSAAALMLGQMLYSRYMTASTPMPGKPGGAMSEQERTTLRTEIINDYALALKRVEDQSTRFTLAELYQEAGQKDKALDQYKRIKRLLSWDPDKPETKYAHMRLLAGFKKLGADDLAAQEEKTVAEITAKEKRAEAEKKAEQERLAAQKKADDARIAELKRKAGKTPDASKPAEPGASTVLPGGTITVQPGGGVTVPGPGVPAPTQTPAGR